MTNETKMKRLQQLEHDIAEGIGGNRYIAVQSFTDARAKKTGNPYGKIMKRSISVMNGSLKQYAEKVRKALERAGADAPKFKAIPTYCKPIAGSEMLMEHVKDGTIYLRLYIVNGTKSRVIAYYAEDGTKLTYEQVKQFLPERHDIPGRQSDAGLQEGEFVQPRNYKLESLEYVKAGKVYIK